MTAPLHSTPRPDAPPAPLPLGVTRCPQTTPDATLANCWALRLNLRTLDGSREFELVVWGDQPTRVRPIDKPRFTALRPGDRVSWKGRLYEVAGVEVWR